MKYKFSKRSFISLIVLLHISIAFSEDNFPNGEFSQFRRISPRVLQEESQSNHRAHLREKRHIQLDSTQKGKLHSEKISIELPIDSKLFWLDLYLNRDLITKGYFQEIQKNGQKNTLNPNVEETELCHYQGKIRGITHSWAALSTCDSSISGVVFDGESHHYFEPANGSNWDTFHYKESDLNREFHCGHNHSSIGLKWSKDLNSSGHQNGVQRQRVKRSYEGTVVPDPYGSNEKTRYVEMVVVVDNKKFIDLNRDLSKVYRRTKDIINIVNAVYIPLNIFVALTGVVVWTETDEITLSTAGEDTLNSFLHYRQERLLKTHPNDNAQLLTAMEFKDGVVGKAMQGPICSYKFSGGVNSDYKSTIGVVATTVAHELGHNFGLSHDSESCECPGHEGRCIMSASSGSNKTTNWSSCSKKDLQFAFDHGMDYCLLNKPKSLFQSPTCGNGFLEAGEDCDCGVPEHCNNFCCNPHTCKFQNNATCATGTCCDKRTCHFMHGGNVCRKARSSCDLPEYCSGDSELCPEDFHKLDGLDCETESGKAHCFDGQCRTHTDQCRLLWGSSGNNSIQLCYAKNTNGTKHAHCGLNYPNMTYAKCAPEDVRCGALHCSFNHEKLEFGYETTATLQSFFVNAGGKIHPCRSVSVDFGLEVVDPGLVPDGAICGDGKMCVKQKCVSVNSVLYPLKKDCGEDCGSNGVCNSAGHCHCDEGFGGSLCDGSGHGGSIDSGPSTDPYHSSIIGKSLVVTFFGFIPLIAIISFYLYHANENFKKICKRGQIARTQNSNNKPSSNGSGGGRRVEISNPSAGPKPVAPTEIFGQFKGFTLSPIKPTAEPIGTNNNVGTETTTVKSPTRTNVYENPSKENGKSDVYYSPVAKTEEKLVQNNVKSAISIAKANFLQKGIARVSWAQPIASPLPVSPPSEDESANSDTPLYENTNETLKSVASKVRPLSSPESDFKSFELPPPPKESSPSRFASSSSALTRIALAIPFVRNSLRTSSSSEDSNKFSGSFGRQKNNKINRNTLEISEPILQGEMKDTKINSKSIEHPDTIDSSVNGIKSPSPNTTRTPSKPLILAKPNIVNKPSPRVLERIRQTSPSPPSGEKPHVPEKKVARAQSMIQPNRNSTGSTGNYNSLRRNRPSAPPPAPPVSPPPPPPPVQNQAKSRSLSPNLSSILKFSLGGRYNKAPIAKIDDSLSPTTPLPPVPIQSVPESAPVDNIYDVIAEPPMSDMRNEEAKKLDEKIETLSTGSAESNGGLLSEIIFEIQSRNKESIYNSVDRRKKKREAEKLAKGNLSPKLVQKAINVQKGIKISSPSPPPKETDTGCRGRDLHRQSASPSPKPPNAPKPPVPEQPIVKPVPILAKSTLASTSKPTCAVNGIPKVTATTISPSYVAKINYFSNLTPGGGPPMKPLSSLPPPSSNSGGQESIYAPSNVSSVNNGENKHLSTIRPTWSRAHSAKSYLENNFVNNEESCEKYEKPAAPHQDKQTNVYGTNPSQNQSNGKDGGKAAAAGTSQAGYKSFTPYLNRPLTFSTFRPNNQTGPSKSNSLPAASATNASVLLPNQIPVTGCSVSIGKEQVKLGERKIASPVQMRSPTRLVK